MALSAADFGYIRKLVEDHSAIVLSADKDYLAEARLGPVARQEGLASIEQLVARLRAAAYDRLHKRVVEAMTTNETSFFRDVAPFAVLRGHLIPQIVQRRPNAYIQIWSAACSTGQEPYSIALTFLEHFPELAPRVRILATDLNEQVLDKARQGRFSQLEVNRGLPAPMLVKYFTRAGADWELKPEVRRMVEFRPLNLVAPLPPLALFDLVFMRNVLIYFDVPKRQLALAGVRKNLAPKGVLFLGTAETTLAIDDSFERVQLEKTTFYVPKAA